jgi:hypothetical protein
MPSFTNAGEFLSETLIWNKLTGPQEHMQLANMSPQMELISSEPLHMSYMQTSCHQPHPVGYKDCHQRLHDLQSQPDVTESLGASAGLNIYIINVHDLQAWEEHAERLSNLSNDLACFSKFVLSELLFGIFGTRRIPTILLQWSGVVIIIMVANIGGDSLYRRVNK